MTHDELIAKMAEPAHSLNANDARNVYLLALSAVVKIHRPIEGHEHLCAGCWFGDGMMAYPCPTIQAIEKELQ
jgi:hypothetical protein